MTRIYLIRHGESEWNKLYKVQGQKNTKLTDKGKIQAIKLGERLVDEGIDLIYTSDLERAYETAKIISEIINRPLLVNEHLREIKFGPWEGLSIEEIKSLFKEEYSMWLSRPHKLNLNGAETLEELKLRVMSFIYKIMEQNNGRNIGIVSHGTALKSMILGLLGIDMSYYKNFTLGNVSLSIVECRDYNNVLTLLNDNSHLKGL